MSSWVERTAAAAAADPSFLWILNFMSALTDRGTARLRDSWKRQTGWEEGGSIQMRRISRDKLNLLGL